MSAFDDFMIGQAVDSSQEILKLKDQNRALTAQNAKLSTLLDSLRNNIDAGLLTALRNGGQLDMDGCEVRVSRQACEEAADHLEQFAALKQAQP